MHPVRFLLAFIALLSIPLIGVAQTLGGVEQGIKPYGSYEGGDIDSISMANGSITLNIPLLSYPQRGSKLHGGFRLVYTNPWLQPWATCNPVRHVCSSTGYNLAYLLDPSQCTSAVPGGMTCGTAMSVAADFGYGLNVVFAPGCCPQGAKYYTVIDPDDAVHQMGSIGSGLWRSVDTTGYLLAAPSSSPNGTGTLWDRQGNKYYFSAWGITKIEDPNGNLVTPNTSGWTDTLGRVVPVAASTTDLSHCPSSATAASLWSGPGPNGGTSQYKFCYATINISFSAGGTQPTSTTASNIVGIVLPNLTAWTFAYDNYGELTTITLPTGGSISYTWTSIHGLCVAPQYVDPNGVYTSLWPYRRAVTSRTVNANDGTGPHTWNYVGNTGGGQAIATDPLGNDTVHTETFLGGTCSIYETELDRYSGSHTTGTLLQKTTTSYNYSPGGGAPGFGNVVINVVPNTVTITDAVSGKTSQVTKTFDTGVSGILLGTLLSENHYDWGNGSPGNLLLQTNTQYMALTGPNSSSYLANNMLSLPYTVQVLDGSGAQKALTQYNYDESSLGSSGVGSSEQHDTAPPNGTYRGNQTSILRWLNTGTMTCPNGHSAGTGSNVTSKLTYFDTGTLQTSADPCGNTTTYAYSNTYWGSLPTTVTNALGQATTNAYDFNTSLITSTTDSNNLTTSFTYDSMRRPATITHPDGGVDSVTHQETTYPFSATLTKAINPSQNEVSTNVFDGLGRLTESQLTSDPQGTDYTDTTYDVLGRVSTVSNPYRKGTDITTSSGITTYGYDALSRKISVTYPDSSVLSTAYCGPSTLVTDPAGRWRRSRVDGLGHLVEVDEPNAVGASVASTGCPGTGEPIWITSYTDDALGNLTQIVQNGSHTRTFTYDSLSRMLTSNNPEVGTITYVYNPDGTAASKTDARAIVSSYAYDALHRELTTSYSNGDPTITSVYDQATCLGLSACQNIGQRTSMTDAAGSEFWAYQVDLTNHLSIHVNQRTNTSTPTNVTKTSTYYLDYAGNITQVVYPTGRVVNYTYDSANRPSTAIDGSNGVPYATGLKTSLGGTCLANVTCYTPQGTFYSLSIGQTSSFTGLNLTDIYNNRLQPQEFKASSTGGNAIDITYSFVDSVSGKNAGHVNGITNNLDTTRSQTFTYDQLNRITSAQTTSTYATSPTHCWGEAYTLDAWANLQSIAATTNTNYTGCTVEGGFSHAADGNNHLAGFTYDAAGNTSSDGVYSNYVWDGESQLKSVNGTSYAYDGSGRRAAKVGSKLYWYGSGGEILAETNASGNTTAEYIFFAGKRIAMLPAGSNPIYYVEDRLGTSRVLTSNTGAVCYDADFYPYGGERAYTNTCAQNYKFEGKERDTESGNDDFGARYYSNRFGRWLSADWSAAPVPVPYANLTNPQTLNLYSMVADDPESFADLDGHENVALGQHTDDEIKKRKNEIKQELKNKDLTDEQRDALKKERNTLDLEQEGNHVVSNMLTNLNKVDPGNGLKLSDFTLSTDTKNDFAGKLSERDLNSALSSQAFVLPQSYGVLSQTIYIRTEPSTGFYQMSKRDSDYVYFGASALVHEGAHRISHFDERNAFYVQSFVLHEFKNYFQNAATYRRLDEFVQNCMQNFANCH